MNYKRPRFAGFISNFCEDFQQALLINLQPRIPSRRFALFCIVPILAVIAAATPRSAGASGPLTATPVSASFGSVPVGTANTQSLRLKNTGTAALTISSVTISGAGFSMSGVPTPSTIAPGASINATVRFAPTSASSYAGKVTVVSNASNYTTTIGLTGTGVGATRTLSLSSSGLNFGNEIVGATSALEVAVKNTGNSSVLISEMSINGTGFSATSNLGGVTLAAGQSANLLVDFAPRVAGSETGQIVLTSNATNSPSSISLTGAGVTSTGHSVTLSWTQSSSTGVIGYNVYRSTSSGGAYSRLNSSSTPLTKYTDESVAPGETYYYEVTALNSAGEESAHSGPITATIP